jgi:hypothetical protein
MWLQNIDSRDLVGKISGFKGLRPFERVLGKEKAAWRIACGSLVDVSSGSILTS